MITYPMPSTEAVSHSLGLSDRKMALTPVAFYLEARAALALAWIKADLSIVRNLSNGCNDCLQNLLLEARAHRQVLVESKP